jgi:hypothetical protein
MEGAGRGRKAPAKLRVTAQRPRIFRASLAERRNPGETALRASGIPSIVSRALKPRKIGPLSRDIAMLGICATERAGIAMLGICATERAGLAGGGGTRIRGASACGRHGPRRRDGAI